MIGDTMKSLLRQYGPSLLSGALLASAFPKWGLHPAAWIALVPLLVQSRGASPKQAFGRFLLAGWAFNAFLLHWLAANVYWAGGWAFFGYQVLCLILALFWGMTGTAWVLLRVRMPWAGGGVGFALLWAAMEFLQAHLFSGFGWGAAAYSQGPNLLLAQWAAVGGAPLVSAIVAACNAWIAASISGWIDGGERRGLFAARPLACAGILMAVAHGIGWWMIDKPDYASRPFSAGIIQTNFSLEMKWDREYTAEMVRNAAQKSRWLAQHERVDLFVWPEAAVMANVDDPRIWPELSGLVKDTKAYLFTGAGHDNEKTGGSPNSSCLIDPDAAVVDYYDKVHLVPFGEYVPFAKYFPFIQQVVPAIGDVEFGSELKILKARGRSFGPLICFEVLYANLAERLRRMGADFLVVITNLGWFGQSSAIPQEYELARMRAIETRLPLVHCANTGISGVFDPWGRFAPVAGVFGPTGMYANYAGRIAPEQTVMQRLAASLPVSAPAKRPVPYGPVAFPWVALVASGLLLLCAALKPQEGVHPSKPRPRRKERA